MASFLKKNLSLLVGVASVIALAGAVLLFIFPVLQGDAAYKTVMGAIAAIILLVFAILGGVYIFLEMDREPNFFLQDRERKRNMPVEKLTFTHVNERLNFLLTTVSESAQELWEGDVLENELKLGYRRVYRPLIAYKMLYDLADKNVDTYWAYLENASPLTIASLAGALEQAGETEFPKVLRFITENHQGDSAKLRTFISGNIKFLRTRIMAYVKKNIELFY